MRVPSDMLTEILSFVHLDHFQQLLLTTLSRDDVIHRVFKQRVFEKLMPTFVQKNSGCISLPVYNCPLLHIYATNTDQIWAMIMRTIGVLVPDCCLRGLLFNPGECCTANNAHIQAYLFRDNAVFNRCFAQNYILHHSEPQRFHSRAPTSWVECTRWGGIIELGLQTVGSRIACVHPIRALRSMCNRLVVQLQSIHNTQRTRFGIAGCCPYDTTLPCSQKHRNAMQVAQFTATRLKRLLLARQ